MTQVAAYWPIRQQANVSFNQAFTFPSSVAGYSDWSLTIYDSPETLNVLVASSAFTYVVGGTGNTTLTVTGASELLTPPAMGYYELIGTPSGGVPTPIAHGPYVSEG